MPLLFLLLAGSNEPGIVRFLEREKDDAESCREHIEDDGQCAEFRPHN
jgi:hypothetical protein